MSNISVFSEIGNLKKVLLHRPNKETNRLDVSLFEYMLFDDIMDYKVAQQEHDNFANILRNNGVEVMYLEDLLVEIFKDKTIYKSFLLDYLKESNVIDKVIFDACFDFLWSFKNMKNAVNQIIMGIKKNEVVVKNDHSLSFYFHMKNTYPFFVNPIPNILFQRDPIASIFNSFNIHKMSKLVRKKETLFYKYLCDYHPFFKEQDLTYDRSDPFSIEGGDILVISEKLLLIAISERTMPEAIELLAIRLFQRYPKLEKIAAIDIPKGHATMHLDTIVTHVNHDVFLMDTEMFNEKYEVCILTSKNKKNLHIEIMKGKMVKILSKLLKRDIKVALTGDGDPLRSRREQWTDGANALTIKPGVVITYSRNTYTIKALERLGIKVFKTLDSELSRGRGGPRCMTMPLWREDCEV